MELFERKLEHKNLAIGSNDVRGSRQKIQIEIHDEAKLSI